MKQLVILFVSLIILVSCKKEDPMTVRDFEGTYNGTITNYLHTVRYDTVINDLVPFDTSYTTSAVYTVTATSDNTFKLTGPNAFVGTYEMKDVFTENEVVAAPYKQTYRFALPGDFYFTSAEYRTRYSTNTTFTGKR